MSRQPRIKNRPADVTKARPLTLERVPTPPALTARFNTSNNAVIEVWRLGACSVIVTRENRRYHLSVAHPDRLPTWSEISQAWYRLIEPRLTPGHVGALILPRLDQYTNLHPNCMQVFEIDTPTEDPYV